jgi:hypothetical protein
MAQDALNLQGSSISAVNRGVSEDHCLLRQSSSHPAIAIYTRTGANGNADPRGLADTGVSPSEVAACPVKRELAPTATVGGIR